MPGAAAAASTVPIPAMPALSGDITTTAGSTSTTLATVSTTSGSVGSSTAIPVLTTNAKGLVTAQSTAVVVAPAGTLSGAALASGVVTSSLTSVGALAMGSLASGFTPVAGSLISSTAALAGGATCRGDFGRAWWSQAGRNDDYEHCRRDQRYLWDDGGYCDAGERCPYYSGDLSSMGVHQRPDAFQRCWDSKH